MTVESATHPDDLNTALPAAGDFVSEGDDHLRLIKTVLKGSAFRDITDVPMIPVQRVETTHDTLVTTTATFPLDDTIPQNTEGYEWATVAITPKNANNLLHIRVHGCFGGGVNVKCTGALFKDSAADAIRVATATTDTSNTQSIIDLEHWIVAGGTSEITFKLRVGSGATEGDTLYLNGISLGSTRVYGGKSYLSFDVMEYQQT